VQWLPCALREMKITDEKIGSTRVTRAVCGFFYFCIVLFSSSTSQMASLQWQPGDREVMETIVARGRVIAGSYEQPVAPTIDGAVTRLLPFAQGDDAACAPICVALACALLVNPGIVAPPLRVDIEQVRRVFLLGLEWWREAVAARRRNRRLLKQPITEETDREDRFFSAGAVADKHNAGRYIKREATCFAGKRFAVPGPVPGVVPRLLDELEGISNGAIVGEPRAVVLTALGYTVLVFLRHDGAWLFDSHGATSSVVAYFYTLEALLRYLLRKMAGLSVDEIDANVAQLLEPALRTPDGVYDATVKCKGEIELLELRLCKATAPL